MPTAPKISKSSGPRSTTPGRDHWRDLVPHRPGIYILSFSILEDWLIRLEREDGLPRIVVRRFDSGEEHIIAFAEEAYSLGFEGGYEFVTNLLRFIYSSMTTPSEVWDYDLTTRHAHAAQAPGGSAAATIPRPTSRGGCSRPRRTAKRCRSPCCIARMRRSTARRPACSTATAPTASPFPPASTPTGLSLVDRGFLYAIAHVRGGTEKGWRWYREGKLTNKPNTFHDFIAATEYLVQNGWTGRGKVVAHGGSAGGMLIGAVANLRPDLYAAMMAEVPFVDVLNTMLDETLPLTPPEYPEWGDPSRDAEAFRTILGYSPYENVRAQDYPAMLMLAGLTDPRVTVLGAGEVGGAAAATAHRSQSHRLSHQS